MVHKRRTSHFLTSDFPEYCPSFLAEGSQERPEEKDDDDSLAATGHCRFPISLIHLGSSFFCILKFNLDPQAWRLFGLIKWNHSDGFSLCALANWNVKWNQNTETDRLPSVPPVTESWVMTSRHDKRLFGLALYRTGVFSCGQLMGLSQFHAIGLSLIEIWDHFMGSGNEVLCPQHTANHFEGFLALLLSFLCTDDFSGCS